MGCIMLVNFMTCGNPSSGPESKGLLQDSKPSVSNIQILEYRLKSEGSRQQFVSVIGELKNNNRMATGVQLLVIARDNQGRVIDNAMIWPASITNIPAGATWPIQYMFSDGENITTVEIRVMDVKIWQEE
jgi:hypothetical protein